MAIVQQPLKEWAAREREARNWSIRELAARVNSPHSSIRRAFNDNDRVGVEVCIRLANAFNKPVYDVLEMAGLVPRRPEETKMMAELRLLFDQLPQDKQYDLIDYAKFLMKK